MKKGGCLTWLMIIVLLSLIITYLPQIVGVGLLVLIIVLFVRFQRKQKRNARNGQFYDTVEENAKRKIDKTTYKVAVCVGGFLGAHRFIRGQIAFGILYLLTGGLFYIGWIRDAILSFTQDPISKDGFYYFSSKGHFINQDGGVLSQVKTQKEASVIKRPLQNENDWKNQISRIAPELSETVNKIYTTKLKIDQAIEESQLSNKQELTEIYKVGYQRFLDILKKYLKIAAEPEDYNNPELRMAEGKAAIEAYREKLQQAIRAFNEEDMHDFEIALRLMKEEKEE